MAYENDRSGFLATSGVDLDQLSDLQRRNQELEGLLDRSGSPFGYSSAAKGGKGQLAQISKLMDFLYGRQSTLYSQAEFAQRTGQKAIKDSFAGVRDAISRRGDASRTEILKREQQRLGGTEQNLLSRGYGGAGSVRDAAMGEVYSSASSALAELDASLAEMDAAALMNEGAAMNQSQLGLSQLYQNQIGTELGLGQGWSQILAGIEHRNDDSGNAGSLIGGLLGLALG